MAVGAAHSLIDDFVFLFWCAGDAHGPFERTELCGKILGFLELEVCVCGLARSDLHGPGTVQVVPRGSDREGVFPGLNVAAGKAVIPFRIAHHRNSEVGAVASSAYDDTL